VIVVGSPWPELDPLALHGLAGELVRRIEPETESDPVALLVDLLTSFGAAVGPGPHMWVDRTEHPARLFSLIIGDTARARKGTSRNNIAALMNVADERWAATRVFNGLSTGEGLVALVQDSADEDGEVHVTDKRTLVVESEFARLLSVGGRENNTLSSLVRQAWDGGTLSVRTRNRPLTATGAHISMIGHVTRADLSRHLTNTEIRNGFANRFLWVASKKSKSLPTGGNLTDLDIEEMGLKLNAALHRARQFGRMGWTPKGAEKWDSVYRSLGENEHSNPVVDALLSRSEAQVLRLSLIYALLDGSQGINPRHIAAALALWDYCQASILYIYEDNSTGHPKADRVLEWLREADDRVLNRLLIQRRFHGHVLTKELDEIIGVLSELGLAHEETIKTAGRSRRRWVLDED
jgi:hypothetical protein